MCVHWIIIFLNVVLLQNQVTAMQRTGSIPCPSFCKCEPGNQKPDSNRGKSHSVMANCFILSSMLKLKCAEDWDVLHLVILHSPGKESGTNVPAGAEVTSPSSNLLTECGSVSRLAIWEQSQITSLPLHFLRPLIQLTRLIIQVPTLVTLPDRLLAFLPNLEFVKISNCRSLHQLGHLVFRHCPSSLQTLELNGNPLLQYISPGQFEHCDLHVLNLNDNRLKRLDWGSLRGLNKLETLRLDRNQLNGSLATSLGFHRGMKTTALTDTPLLKRLDVSGNQLSSIEDYTWSGLCELGETGSKGLCFLEELNLADNRLEWLGPDAFHGLPQLRRLHLERNAKFHQPDSSGSLAVALYVLGTKRTLLEKVTLTIPPKNETNSHNRQKTLNICSPDPSSILPFPRVLREVFSIMVKTSCVRPGGKFESFAYHKVTQQPNKKQPIAKTEGIVPNNFSETNTTRGKVDYVIFHMPNVNRFTMLLICFGFISLGILMGLFPAIYILCSRRTRKKHKASAPTMHCCPHQTHQGGYPPNGNMLLHNSPSLQHARSHANTPFQVNGLPPISQNYSPITYSTDHLRMVPAQRDCQERRVNSTGNVYIQPEKRHVGRQCNVRREERIPLQNSVITNNRFPQPTSHFPHPYSSISATPPLMLLPPIPTYATPRHSYPRSNRLSMEMRPLLQPSTGTRTESVYAHTTETQVLSSTYSLATVNSFHRPSSPMQRPTPGSTHRVIV